MHQGASWALEAITADACASTGCIRHIIAVVIIIIIIIIIITIIIIIVVVVVVSPSDCEGMLRAWIRLLCSGLGRELLLLAPLD